MAEYCHNSCSKCPPFSAHMREDAHTINQLDAGMWRYHANRMDARRSQFDLGRVDAYI